MASKTSTADTAASRKPLKKWLTSREAADIVGCCPRSVVSLCKAGALDAFRGGTGIWWIERASAERSAMKHEAEMRFLRRKER